MTGKNLEQRAFEERLRLKIEAYHEAALVYAAVKLDLPDRMGERTWTAEQLAGALGISAPHLFRFLRGLVTLGICKEAELSLRRRPNRMKPKITHLVGDAPHAWQVVIAASLSRQ